MRVLVAMSGGVDSSVAALLAEREGHDVVGVTLKLWGGESDTGCCAATDSQDARRVADHLGIDHHTFAFTDAFEADVVSPYVDAHAAGRTPNPCIACNRHVKFDRLLARAETLGFDALATGHHARRITMADGTHRVARGADAAKDQSYVLATLSADQLARVRFPVGEHSKAEVRALAAEAGLGTATKAESQDVCFITRARGRRDFLSRRRPLTPAAVVTTEGDQVGEVDAAELVTIGQRRGLGVPGGEEPRYAVDVDPAAATVTVGTAEELRVRTQPVEELAWVGEPLTGQVAAQVRAHGHSGPARVEPAFWRTDPPSEGGSVRQKYDGEGDTDDGGDEADGIAGDLLVWTEPQPRVAPGQAIALYDGDVVIGSATAA